MLALKAKYEKGRIELVEPMPADIKMAELNIIVIPADEKKLQTKPVEENYLSSKTSEEEFKQLGLSAFFDNEDDIGMDWEDCFGLK